MSKWWDRSWNPIVGCSHASPGCENCYAEKLASTRLKHLQVYGDATVGRKWNGTVVETGKLDQPLGWKKPNRVFVADMSDLFHPGVPFSFIAGVYGVMAACPNQTFIVLTKRPDRMLEWYRWAEVKFNRYGGVECDVADGLMFHAADYHRLHRLNAKLDKAPIGEGRWPLPNVWTGTTCENQEWATRRVLIMRRVPSVLRFLSLEPLLDEVDPSNIETATATEHRVYNALEKDFGWLIPGGESGHGARQCNRKWLERIVYKGRKHGVPVFVKQLGSHYVDELNGIGGKMCKPDESVVGKIRRLKDFAGRDMSEWPENLRIRQFPKVEVAA